MVKSTYYIMKSGFICQIGILNSAQGNPVAFSSHCTLDYPEDILENTDVRLHPDHFDQNLRSMGIAIFSKSPELFPSNARVEITSLTLYIPVLSSAKCE